MSLEIKDLNITLSSDDPVVENISFQLEKGEMLSIVGSSGAGKTTICKAVMGLLGNAYRAKGSILFHGRELLTLLDRERRTIYGKEICLIMQNPMTAFNPSIRVARQLEKPISFITVRPPGKKCMKFSQISCSDLDWRIQPVS